MIVISPSILSCDFSKLGEEISATDNTPAEYIHMDVMDGRFVPNLTIGPCVISSLRKYTDKVFDVHLMIEEPIRYVRDFINAGADIVTVHTEACSDIKKTLTTIRECGAKSGLSIKPKTDPKILEPYLHLCDMVLIMTVEPGFGGQSFLFDAVKNINYAKAMIEKCGKAIPIEVDGGITPETIGYAAKAGAEIFVAGSAVYKQSPRPEQSDQSRQTDIALAVQRLIESASQAMCTQ